MVIPCRYGNVPNGFPPQPDTPTVMTLELELENADQSDEVHLIHHFLEPAKLHISQGGKVTLTRSGEVIGTAETLEDLYRLATL